MYILQWKESKDLKYMYFKKHQFPNSRKKKKYVKITPGARNIYLTLWLVVILTSFLCGFFLFNISL